MKLSAVVPGLAEELAAGLRAAGRPDLAEQIRDLEIRELCRCEVEGCASFYTGIPMKRWFRRGKQVPAGDLVVDTIDGQIVYVEVLGRPDLRRALRL
ncbi:MAG TPA: hypothetical protein VFA24_04130 [Gaiellaceae bacterium]|nr:hypothetical protein [Gaiellaceae bacterium]